MLDNIAFQNFKYIFYALWSKNVVLLCYAIFSKLLSSQYIKQGNAEEAAWVEKGDLVGGLKQHPKKHRKVGLWKMWKRDQAWMRESQNVFR